MRILLDAKDLINVAEQGKPMSLDKFGEWLTRQSAQPVLTMTNVTQLVAPLKQSRIGYRPLQKLIVSAQLPGDTRPTSSNRT